MTIYLVLFLLLPLFGIVTFLVLVLKDSYESRHRSG